MAETWAGSRDFFVKGFSDAAFTQEIGEIGKPVKTDFGYHIIQVIARQELPLSDSQCEQKKDTAFNDWLTAAPKKPRLRHSRPGKSTFRWNQRFRLSNKLFLK